MKTLKKRIPALLLALAVLFAGMPAILAFAEDGEPQIITDPALLPSDEDLAQLQQMIERLPDAVQLYYYTDEAILRVAQALGSDTTDADAFVQDAIRNGYRYLGDNTACAVKEAAYALMTLTSPTSTDMDSLNAVSHENGYARAICRDESKAHVSITTVPYAVNDMALDPDTSGLRIHAGDTITFRLLLDTDYYVASMLAQIVYDCTAFHPVDIDGVAYTQEELAKADADLFIDPYLAAEARRNYDIELFSKDSAPKQYPAPYRNEAYMAQYKIMAVYMSTKFTTRTRVLRFGTDVDHLICTFAMEAQHDMYYDGRNAYAIGCPEEWYAQSSTYEYCAKVSRAAGYLADGVTPASICQNGEVIRDRDKAAFACNVADIFASFDQTYTSVTTFGSGQTILQPELILDTGTGKAEKGETINVSVQLQNNPGVCATRIYLHYDPAVLELQSAVNGTVFDDLCYQGGDVSKIPFVAFWIDKNGDSTANGTLVTYTFRVLPDAPDGNTVVRITYDAGSAFNQDMLPVTYSVQNGSLNVLSSLGDVNDDGRVDCKDVVLLQRYLAGWDVLICEKNADVNRDGVIDLRDLYMIIRHIVGGWGVVF